MQQYANGWGGGGGGEPLLVARATRGLFRHWILKTVFSLRWVDSPLPLPGGIFGSGWLHFLMENVSVFPFASFQNEWDWRGRRGNLGVLICILEWKASFRSGRSVNNSLIFADPVPTPSHLWLFCFFSTWSKIPKLQSSAESPSLNSNELVAAKMAVSLGTEPCRGAQAGCPAVP